MAVVQHRIERKTWTQALQDGCFSGAVASILSAAALATCGRLEGGTAAGPMNGPSQWIWGRFAKHRRSASVRHTVVGYLIHHVMASGWAVLHEKTFGTTGSQRSAGRELRNGAATAALACFVDYRLTPKRLEPGFEAQLSKTSLLAVYSAFAVGLAVSACRKR